VADNYIGRAVISIVTAFAIVPIHSDMYGIAKYLSHMYTDGYYMCVSCVCVFAWDGGASRITDCQDGL